MEIWKDVVEPTAAREIPDGKVTIPASRDSREIAFIIQDGKRPMSHGNGFGNARGPRGMQYNNGIVPGLFKAPLLVRELLVLSFEHLLERRRGKGSKARLDAFELFYNRSNLCRKNNDGASCLFQQRHIRRGRVAGRREKHLLRIRSYSITWQISLTLYPHFTAPKKIATLRRSGMPM